MNKRVCVVVGVGPGNGAALARAFSADGLAVALLARRTEWIDELAAELPGAEAFACDVTEPVSIAQAFDAIRSRMGEPEVVVYNAGSGVWGDVESIDIDTFESAWRVNALGALIVSREVVPAMVKAGRGTLLFISATAAKRGGANTAAFAPAKAAQRSLAESMARSLGPKGIHVALIIVDAVVDLPSTRDAMPEKRDSFFLTPQDMAVTAVHLANQPRSAWTFEVEVRPYAERW